MIKGEPIRSMEERLQDTGVIGTEREQHPESQPSSSDETQQVQESLELHSPVGKGQTQPQEPEKQPVASVGASRNMARGGQKML